MKKKLTLSFRKFKDPDLFNMAMLICQNLTDNEYFPEIEPMVTPIRETAEQFRSAITQAFMGDILKINIKNDYREKLIPLLRELGEYVEKKANGVDTVLFSSGFLMTKSREDVELQQPTEFRIQPGKNNGEIIMQVKRVLGAKTYMYQYTRDPLTENSQWETVYSTQCKKVITNLPLGVNFLFRMAAIGARDQIVYTRILNRYIS